jgi:deazaflavin-dependent oxidoreductase (nitroreductase family)
VTRRVDFAYGHANRFQRATRGLAASGPGSWLFARVMHRIDRPVHKLTRGRATLASLVSGLPVVALTTTGARSGRPRTVPVLGIPTADGLAVIGSNWGRPGPPAWDRNLRANPSATIAIGDHRYQVRAVAAEGERRERIWREGLEVYPGFAQYAARARDRRFRIYVLERVQKARPLRP